MLGLQACRLAGLKQPLLKQFFPHYCCIVNVFRHSVASSTPPKEPRCVGTRRHLFKVFQVCYSTSTCVWPPHVRFSVQFSGVSAETSCLQVSWGMMGLGLVTSLPWVVKICWSSSEAKMRGRNRRRLSVSQAVMYKWSKIFFSNRQVLRIALPRGVIRRRFLIKKGMREST